MITILSNKFNEDEISHLKISGQVLNLIDIRAMILISFIHYILTELPLLESVASS